MKISVCTGISFLCCLLLQAAPADSLEKTLDLKVAPGQAETFGRVEMGVEGMPTTTNPFDPESIALNVEITPPSGKPLRVPGFFTQDYERKLEGNREVLSTREGGRWCLRWLPLEAGRHRLVATATVQGKPVARGETAIEVTTSKRPGLIRVEPEGKRYFRFDNGEPFFLTGRATRRMPSTAALV